MNRHSIQIGEYMLAPRSPKTVQVEEQRIVHEVVSTPRTCPSCKSESTIFDGLTAEIICTSCGRVIVEKQETPTGDINEKSRPGMPTSLVFPDKGLSTVITFSNTDANGTNLNREQITKINKIRYLDKILGNNKNHLRNFRNAFAIMARTSDKLGLTNPVIERAAYYYRKAFDNKLIKGRAIKEMVVASVYASCKEMHIPRTLQEISIAADAEPVFSGRCYRILSRNLHINPSIVDATTYISKIATRANISQKTYREAVDMLSIAKKNPISYGKDPKSVAAAVLYASCLKKGEENVTQLRIATAGGISIVTLRKRLADILMIFPELLKEKMAT